MQFRVYNLHICVGDDIAGLDFAFATSVNNDLLRALAVQFHAQFLNVKDDFRDIFLDAFHGRKLMQYAIDLDGRSRHTGQGGKQHPAEGVAQRRAKPAFQRFHHEFAVILGQLYAFDFRSFDFYHSLFPSLDFWSVD